MLRRVVASRRLPSFSGPTVLTIVASTSAVAATVVMFLTEFAGWVLTLPNASPETSPSRPIEPSRAPVVLTSVRRVCADSYAFWRSIVSNNWFSTFDILTPCLRIGARRALWSPPIAAWRDLDHSDADVARPRRAEQGLARGTRCASRARIGWSEQARGVVATRRSAHTEAASSRLVELLGLEAVGPAALVVLLREVARAVTVEERLADALGVPLVARAPGGGGDVHDVAPPPLVLDRRDAVDHVAVPPHRVAGLDVRDPAECAHEQRVPLLDRGEHLVDGGAAHVVLVDVGKQRAQHQVGHRLRDRHGVEHALVVRHVRQGGPALEGAEHRAHGRAGVLRTGGPVRGVPRVVLLHGAVEQVLEGLLVGAGHPQVERAGVEVSAQTAGVGAGRATADAVGVERVAVGVEPLHAV